MVQNMLNENILNAWLKLSTTICNEKLVAEMPYNESLICNILYHNAAEHMDKKITATELCEQTNIQKSQMNRTLNCMEEKGLISRRRSERDKRQVYVSLNMKNAGIYERQHEKILNLVDEMVDKIGKEKAEEVIQLFELLTNKAKEVIGS